jgi:uncharacterized protein YecT (DUF1311 family)
VKPSTGDWLTGTLLADDTAPKTDAESGWAADRKAEPARPATIKLRRQGETVRLVLLDANWDNASSVACQYLWQVTASYFASGESDATDKSEILFSAPTLDCTRPETASDGKICADPDLADNDRRLNRAWKALLPRLDDTTRRALTENQHKWIRAQAMQYPEFLHPAWEKQNSHMHFTTDARDKLDHLQRERIALLEGFDDTRTGLAGLWLSSTAILTVTPTDWPNLSRNCVYSLGVIVRSTSQELLSCSKMRATRDSILKAGGSRS